MDLVRIRMCAAMLKSTHALLLTAVAILVGCAHRHDISTTGSLQGAEGRSFTIRGDSATTSRVAAGLSSAGMRQVSGKGDYLVSVSREEREATRRMHTGGKNGIAYDRTAKEAVLVLRVARAEAPDATLFTAIADAGDAESLVTAARAAMRR